MNLPNNKELLYTSHEFIKTIPSIVETMYNNDIVFMFYSNSKDDIPGKGIREKMIIGEENKYIPLLETNWRKKLSNFWVQPFKLDNKQWSSVEHYYQGSKFKKENPLFYHLFSIDSDSDICKDPNMAKMAGSKSGKINKKNGGLKMSLLILIFSQIIVIMKKCIKHNLQNLRKMMI